jgi:tetratricopeptide (TPR) repeat protein
MENSDIQYSFEGISADDLKMAINHNKFGGLCLQSDKHDKALVHFEKALELVKNKHIFTNVYQNIGNLYAQQNKIDEALKYYHLVIEHSPHNTKNQQAKRNLILLQKVLNSKEAFVDAYTNMGMLFEF